MGINEYCKAKGHFIAPHTDNRYLEGPIIISISLLIDCLMTYTPANSSANPMDSQDNETSSSSPSSTSVYLPKRSLLVMEGDARYKWKHAIFNQDLFGERRISLTFREAGLMK